MVKKRSAPKRTKKEGPSTHAGKQTTVEDAGDVEPKRVRATSPSVEIEQDLLSKFASSWVAPFLLLLLAVAAVSFSMKVSLLVVAAGGMVCVVARRSSRCTTMVKGVLMRMSLPPRQVQEHVEHIEPTPGPEVALQAHAVPAPAMKLARAWLESARARGRGGEAQPATYDCTAPEMQVPEEKIPSAGGTPPPEKMAASSRLARQEFAVRRTFITLLDEHQASGVEDACSDPTTGGGELVLGPRRWPKKKQQLLQKWPNADGGTSAEESSASDWPAAVRPASPHLFNVLETEDELEAPWANVQHGGAVGSTMSAIVADYSVQTPEGAALHPLFMRSAEAAAVPIIDSAGTEAMQDRSTSQPCEIISVDHSAMLDLKDESEDAEQPAWVGEMMGQSARISGLTHAPQFNGQSCEISGYDATMDRFLVRVLQPEGPVSAKLRLQNLTLGLQEGMLTLPAGVNREPLAAQRKIQDATRADLAHNAFNPIQSTEIMATTKCSTSGQLEGLPLAAPVLPEPWPEPWCLLDRPVQSTLGTMPVAAAEPWASYPLSTFQAYSCCQPEAAAAYVPQYGQGYYPEHGRQSEYLSTRDATSPAAVLPHSDVLPSLGGASPGDMDQPTLSAVIEQQPPKRLESHSEPLERSSQADAWRPTLRTAAPLDVAVCNVQPSVFPSVAADDLHEAAGSEVHTEPCEPQVQNVTAQQATHTIRPEKLRRGKKGARLSAQSTESRQELPYSVNTLQTPVATTSTGSDMWKPSLYSKG
mmetsp:Transcript_69314/g.129458  ORF Transcript_69314/g.129458 Transcript_69314/m.129458 type:complete len:758 (-) Transcript_69314:61-2334(-)